MSTDHQDEEAIFHTALEKPSLAERSAYLDEVCGDNAQLRRSVEELLSLHTGADGFLETPPVGSCADEPTGPPDGPGAVIDSYTLRKVLGEGRFGVVDLAEQREPVERNVALKVIKLGMDTRQVGARFEAERQAMAMMDHPCIAKALDAGSTESGRPYFVHGTG